MNSVDCKITVPEKTVNGVKKHLYAEYLRQSAEAILKLKPSDPDANCYCYVEFPYPASSDFAEQLKMIAEFIDSISV